MGAIHNPVVPLVCLASNDHNNQFSSFCPLPDHVISPINVATLNRFLTNHPDRHLVNFLLDGFTNGFSIGYHGSITPEQCRNLLSARHSPDAVSAAILKEVRHGHTAGPFQFMPFEFFHCSPLGAVPKKDGSHRIKESRFAIHFLKVAISHLIKFIKSRSQKSENSNLRK